MKISMMPPPQSIIPIPRTVVKAGETVSIVAKSFVVSRPSYMVIPRRIAACFHVKEIYVGKNAQFMGGGGVPGEVLVRLKLDLLRSEEPLVIVVQNLTSADLTFEAVVYAMEIC